MERLSAYINSKLKKVILKNKRTSIRQNTTLLIIDVDKTESISVNTRLIRSFKPIVIISAVTLILCVTLIIILIGLSVKKSIQVQQAKKAEAEAYQATLDLQDTVKKLQMQSSKELQEKLGTLEATGKTVNELQYYLKERGIKLPKVAPNDNSKSVKDNNDQASDKVLKQTTLTGDFKNHRGGPLIKDVSHMRQYAQQIKVLNGIARNVPIGLPHRGALSSRFGKRSNPFTGRSSEFHHGLDFKGKTGQPIKTTADGVVVTAGKLGGYGLAVKVKHGYGYMTVYGHLSKVNVSVGQELKAGNVIGKLGSTGRSTGPHLHYEIRQKGLFLDPEGFISLTSSAH